MKVWVIMGVSESGDNYGPKVYSYSPTEEEKRQLALDWDSVYNIDYPDGYDGPGDYGSYIYLETYCTEVIDNEV